MTTAEFIDSEPEINKDGYFVNPETGEVVGHVEASDRFTVTDIKSAEWVLAKIQIEEAEAAALETRLRAIAENIGAMKRQHERQREWLLGMYTADLKAFAEAELVGKKTRTLPTPYGSLSFRASVGSVKITDAEAALAWAEENAPDNIKTTRTVLVTGLKDRADELPADAFEYSPAADKFYIKTGL